MGLAWSSWDVDVYGRYQRALGVDVAGVDDNFLEDRGIGGRDAHLTLIRIGVSPAPLPLLCGILWALHIEGKRDRRCLSVR